MTQYWVYVIIQNDGDLKPWLCPCFEPCMTIDEAMTKVDAYKKRYRVISAWVNESTGSDDEHVVYHECHIDMFGRFT